jgi:hypothetical protein
MYCFCMSVSILEDALPGTIVGQATATDADLGDSTSMSFTITGGNTGGLFVIDSTSGKWSIRTY